MYGQSNIQTIYVSLKLCFIRQFISQILLENSVRIYPRGILKTCKMYYFKYVNFSCQNAVIIQHNSYLKYSFKTSVLNDVGIKCNFVLQFCMPFYFTYYMNACRCYCSVGWHLTAYSLYWCTDTHVGDYRIKWQNYLITDSHDSCIEMTHSYSRCSVLCQQLTTL